MRRRAAAPSLTLRLAWRLGALMLAAIGVAAASVAWRAIATVRQLDDTALHAQARAVAAHVAPAPGGGVRVALPAALAAQFAGGDGEGLYLVFDRAGRLLAGSDPAAASAVKPFLPARGGLFQVPGAGVAGQAMIGWLERGTGPFGPFAVAVLQASEPREALIGTLLQEFLAAALWLLAPIALACVAIAVFTLRSGLRPLREASEAATRVGPAHPGLRLPTARLTRELVPLVSAVNEALARLERGLDVQRRFSAEAAHALRTPLAVLMARLDALPESVAEGADLRRDVERMARLVSQMLLMARLEGLPLAAKQAVDLREVAVEALSGLAPLAVRLRVDLSLKEGASVTVAGNHASLVLGLSNLLENALAHAPVGSEVAVEIAPTSGGGRIAVLDRGLGVPPAEAEAVFARFHRGTRPAKGDGGSGAGTGAGLGLAIVAEIVRQHGGSARAEAREGGGAVFILELPREPEGKLAAG